MADNKETTWTAYCVVSWNYLEGKDIERFNSIISGNLNSGLRVLGGLKEYNEDGMLEVHMVKSEEKHDSILPYDSFYVIQDSDLDSLNSVVNQHLKVGYKLLFVEHKRLKINGVVTYRNVLVNNYAS